MGSHVIVPAPDTFDPGLVAQLYEAARTGDWDKLDDLSSQLPSQPVPHTEAAWADHLFALQMSLIAARTTRADIVKSLHRLSAATSFNQCG